MREKVSFVEKQQTRRFHLFVRELSLSLERSQSGTHACRDFRTESSSNLANMADCSGVGTTIDRAARAVIGGTTSATTTAGKHAGALLGHASMFSSAGAATAAISSMPVAAPDHLIMPGAESLGPLLQQQQQQQQQQAPRAVQQPNALSVSSRQHLPQEYNPTIIQHPAGLYQQQQLHHQSMHYQQQMQMQMQMQQQQQAINLMLHQQRQQLQLQKQQQQQLKQSKADVVTERAHQKQQQDSKLGDWHEGLEEEFEREGVTDAFVDNLDEEGIHAFTGGASIDQLAAAWADAEAEYDNVLNDPEQYILEDDDANLWQGDNALLDDNDATRPYEFVNAVDTDGNTANTPNKNYMEEGMKYFREGKIREAIEAFEMELQLQNMDNATAWRMLGRCHAENDQDPEAIRCLEAAVDRDPFCPEALLALGVSYVNELNHERALENLKAWFTHNPRYAGLELPAPASVEEDIYGAAPASANDEDEDVARSHRTAKESAFDEVRSMLEAALAFDPTDAGDIYEALGVIYNVVKDYDAAVDAFRKALESRPDDHQLWNKLGATLANGSRSEQALPTYHQSLKLKPRYARAWLNMAISHSNLQDHDEAARCYLQTLSLNPAATHCWTYLRMSLSSSERWDLLPLVFERNLSGFKEHFDFVLY